MRFVPVKSEACSSVLVLHRARDFLVRQRTRLGNAIRARMAAFGVVVAKGAQNVERLMTHLRDLPEAARLPVSLLFDQLNDTDRRIEQLTGEIKVTHSQSETSQRLATIPGVGVLSATVLAATTPDVGTFGSASDYAAWLGLTPKPHSTGGKQKVGRISKMGDGTSALWARFAMGASRRRRQSVDRTTKFASVELHEKATRRIAGNFVRALAAAVP